MKIEGFEYVQHRMIVRPYGIECQYTVKDVNGFIDSVVDVESEKISEDDLAKAIKTQLDARPILSSEPPEDPIQRAITEKEAEFKALLVAKQLITEAKSIYDIKSKTEYIESDTEETVKP